MATIPPSHTMENDSNIKTLTSMNNSNLVSIIMPAFQCGLYIKDSIDSVINQTHSNWELLIIDDCSTDNTNAIAMQYVDSDTRIKYFRNDKNAGAAVSRNFALRQAKGKWIAFLDADDLWMPTKLEQQIKFMSDNQYNFSYTNYEEIDEDGNPLNILVSGPKHINKFGMYCCCWPGCLTVMYNADYIGLVQINNIQKNNDSALWFKIIQKTKCHLLNANLAKYRRRSGSITPSSIWKRAWWQYRLFRTAEKKCPISAFFWMNMNIFGQIIKKSLYVEKRMNLLMKYFGGLK